MSGAYRVAQAPGIEVEGPITWCPGAAPHCVTCNDWGLVPIEDHYEEEECPDCDGATPDHDPERDGPGSGS